MCDWLAALFTGLLALGVYRIYRFVFTFVHVSDALLAKKDEKCAHRDRLVQNFRSSHPLTPKELSLRAQVLSCKSTSELVKALTIEKKWSAETVVKIYIYAALDAHAATNCLTEVLFDEAISTARSLDAQFAKTGQPSGPLHGVPISLKDHLHISGHGIVYD